MWKAKLHCCLFSKVVKRRRVKEINMNYVAEVVELVDTLSWGGSGASRAGSSPAFDTMMPAGILLCLLPGYIWIWAFCAILPHPFSCGALLIWSTVWLCFTAACKCRLSRLWIVVPLFGFMVCYRRRIKYVLPASWATEHACRNCDAVFYRGCDASRNIWIKDYILC